MTSVKALEYSTWREFKAEFVYDLFGNQTYQPKRFLFRGQQDADWSLTSSFDRWFTQLKLGPNRAAVASELLTLFRKECQSLDLPAEVLGSDVRLWALGQHFGLPTRLLDWSDSPYVAAFFAFSERISQGTFDGHVALWALDLACHVWDGDGGVEVVDVPYIANPRLRNQWGKFTLSKTVYAALEDYVGVCDCSTSPLFKVSLPAAEARVAIADLGAMGISHSRVYPEITGCALAAKTRLLLSRD